MIDVEEIRKSFPILKQKIQLTSCSQSAMHESVRGDLQNYMTSWEEQGMNWSYWMDACEQARLKFAQLIHANENEVAIVSSVSHAISSVLTSIPIEKGKDEIVVSTNDFPCIGHVAQSQQDFKTRFASTDRIGSSLQSYQDNINERTILTTVPHVSFYNGEKLPIEEITKIAGKNNSYTFIDAYQSAGQIEIDVKKLHVDFLAAGMQKYMLGAPGVAFLYIKEEIAEKMTPRITGWFGQSNPFLFDIQGIDYAKGARRFDSGTFPMMNCFAANSAMDVLLTLGVPKIEAYLKELSQYTIDCCLEKGLDIASPLQADQKGSNTAIRTKDADALEQKLREQNILVAARNDVIRIAPHFYNNKADISKTIQQIAKLI